MRLHIDDLCRELAAFILKEEESDSGRVFHPNSISSCRVLDSARMNDILKELKEHEPMLRTYIQPYSVKDI
jgi:hypothetical protein